MVIIVTRLRQRGHEESFLDEICDARREHGGFLKQLFA
jgi:hypothetical protein